MACCCDIEKHKQVQVSNDLSQFSEEQSCSQHCNASHPFEKTTCECADVPKEIIANVTFTCCENPSPGETAEKHSRSLSPVLSDIASSASLSSIVPFPEYDLKPDLSTSEIKCHLARIINSYDSKLIQACRNFDRRLTNKIHKTQLRQILRMFCFPITVAQFDSLLKEVKLYHTGKINYMEFFTKLNDGKSIGCYENSEKLDNVPIYEVELRIKEKISPILRDVIRSFWLFDINKDGFVQKVELRRILKNYCFDLSEQLFEELWKSYDPKGEGVINYKNFLIKLGVNADRYKTFMRLERMRNTLGYTNERSKEPKDNIRTPEKLDCLPVIQYIKNHVLDPVALLHSTNSDINSGKEISSEELRRILEKDLELELTDNQFRELTSVLDPENKNVINCLNLIKLLEGPCNNLNLCQNFSQDQVHKNMPFSQNEKYTNLKGDKLKSKLRHHIEKALNNIENELMSSDPNQSGFMLPEDFLNVLRKCCFSISNEQFKEIISEFKLDRGNLNYREFLDKFRKNRDKDIAKWIGTVNKLATFKSRCPPTMPSDEVKEMLRECIESKKSVMLKDFKALDLCNVGIISKNNLRNLLNKFAFRFNDKQFEELWKTFPRNKFDQFLYDKFLDEYSAPSKKKEINFKDDKADEEIKEKEVSCDNMVLIKQKQSRKSENRKSAKEILYSEAPHLKKIFESVEPTIVRNYRTIRYHLHRADSKLAGKVDFSVLINILRKSGIYLTSEDEFHILEYFDPSLSGKINYKDFLKIFVWYD